MTARVTARLTISFLLLALAFVVFLLLMAAPASAHHREDHTNAKVASTGTDLTGSGDSTDGSETSGTEEGSTAAGSGSAGSTTESSTGSTSGSTSSGSITASVSTSSSTSTSGSTSTTSSTDKHTEKSTTGIAKHGFDPDPVHETTPPATKGPTTCPVYDDGDAGPYDHSNCDGTQALHGGSGNGKCAGCTGKADDKWPGGQYVGDHNNGYECDHNTGIGRGNPAHSRCAAPPPPVVPPPPPPPPCVDNPDTPMDECNPPPPVCVDNPNTPQHECLPPPPPPPPEEDDVEGLIIPNVEPPEERAAQAGPALPVTGATVGNFLWLALLLMGAGLLLLWRIRDRGERA